MVFHLVSVQSERVHTVSGVMTSFIKPRLGVLLLYFPFSRPSCGLVAGWCSGEMVSLLFCKSVCLSVKEEMKGQRTGGWDGGKER